MEKFISFMISGSNLAQRLGLYKSIAIAQNCTLKQAYNKVKYILNN